MQQHIGYRVVDLKALEPFPGNARKHDEGTLYASVKAHGQYRTILVRQLEVPEGDPERLQIIAGHGTADALDARNVTQARVEVCVCTDEEALQINLMDNAATDRASYDPDAMADALRLAQEFDFEGTGWNKKLAEKYLNPTGEGGDAPNDDDKPESWAIIVNCQSEEQQSQLLQQLTEEGFDVKALVT